MAKMTGPEMVMHRLDLLEDFVLDMAITQQQSTVQLAEAANVYAKALEELRNEFLQGQQTPSIVVPFSKQ